MAVEPGRRFSRDAEGLNTGTWPVPGGQFLTPAEDFYTRSHAPIPAIDPDLWRLEVGGLVHRPLSFSLADLERFPRHEITATLVCAGFRRDEFGPLPGELPWGAEPAGTGRWSGFALRDILEAAGVADSAAYVELVGLDRVDRHGQLFGFGGSVDLAKASSPEVLLATDLNDAPLSPEHGFPLRAVIPGWIGARSVKWLGRITLLQEPSTNYFQTRAYRVQRTLNPSDPRDVSGGTALSRVLVNSVILEPVAGQIVSAGRVTVHGWALGTEGRRLSSVELSVNGGSDWTPARLGETSEWSWTLWRAEISLDPGHHTLLVRATDAAGDTQPEEVSATWNVKGYANNAWHRVTVQVE
jgi:sulfite oxidase